MAVNFCPVDVLNLPKNRKKSKFLTLLVPLLDEEKKLT